MIKDAQTSTYLDKLRETMKYANYKETIQFFKNALDKRSKICAALTLEHMRFSLEKFYSGSNRKIEINGDSAALLCLLLLKKAKIPNLYQLVSLLVDGADYSEDDLNNALEGIDDRKFVEYLQKLEISRGQLVYNETLLLGMA